LTTGFGKTASGISVSVAGVKVAEFLAGGVDRGAVYRRTDSNYVNDSAGSNGKALRAKPLTGSPTRHCGLSLRSKLPLAIRFTTTATFQSLSALEIYAVAL